MPRRAIKVPALALAAVLLAMLIAGCSPGTQPASPGTQPAEPSEMPVAEHQHQHADLSPADALLLAGNAVLAVLVLGLVLRPSRVRARADGRWRLEEPDRRPPPAGDH